MKLRELEIGDRFYIPPNKNKRFKVLGKSKWSPSGSALTECLCENDRIIYNKRSYNEVIKLMG